MRKTTLVLILDAFCLLPLTSAFAAPHSNNYQLEDYGFGAGGTDTNTKSGSYQIFGTAGEVEFGNPQSGSYKIGAGLTYLLNAMVPSAPTVSNPGNAYYDRLQVVVNPGNNPSDTTFAMQISTTSDFSSNVSYIKSDGTIGNSLSATDFKTYSSSPNWGGSSGFFVTNLSPNTTYYVRAKSRQGNFTETGWGPGSSGVATVNPSLTFSLNSSSITFSNLNAGNSYTDSGKTSVLTTTTNAYNGYTVYGSETQSLTGPDTTIPDYSSLNSAPTSWSGNGFGYSTSDNNLAGSGGASRFSSGTKYAGFQTSGAGDPVADNTAAVTNDVVTISYRVTVSNTQSPEKYQNTILYTIVPGY